MIGENIATAPGKVVFRNELMELAAIFDPATEEVYERPLLIFPPWINKYLHPRSAAGEHLHPLAGRPGLHRVRRVLGQSRCRLAQKSFEDYMRDGIFAALDAVEEATGVRDPNCVGYCIGGTLLAATLAYMAAKSDQNAARAHPFRHLLGGADRFQRSGRPVGLRRRSPARSAAAADGSAGGVLQGSKMATAFNMLRANDLIWSFVINNYLLGKTADAVRPALLEFRHDADAGEAASVLSAPMLQETMRWRRAR